jgi:hypothetical protein
VLDLEVDVMQTLFDWFILAVLLVLVYIVARL